jgi:hypothetical protein
MKMGRQASSVATHHHPQIEVQDSFGNGQATGRHHAGQAQADKDVENVAAHQVVHDQIDGAVGGCAHRHRHLRRTGAEGHDGQAYHQGRDPPGQ